MKNQQKKFSRRMVALFWLAIVTVGIGTLIYLEQIAALYVIATVALVILLLVVAFADLESVGTEGLDSFGRQTD